jgi:mRNA-degrading endonuclease RelE of RelBE toxin-antitoxin system
VTVENKIYIVNALADTLDRLPHEKREQVAAMIDALAGDGWRNSQIVAPDDAQGGGLRAALSGDLRLLFRYAPEQHAIIVTSVAAIEARELAHAV